MRATYRNPRTRSVLILLLLALAPLAGLAQEPTRTVNAQAESLAGSPSTELVDPSGAGVRARIGCMLCAGALLGVGGTSLLGVAVAALTFPELAGACGLTCAYAFS